jgi:hypothetical protein
VSRRSLLGAAGVGAAGLAAGAFGGVAAAQAATGHSPRPAPRSPDTRQHGEAQPSAGQAAEAAPAPDTSEHVVVHVRSGRDGDIDVYRGTTQTRLHDPELATRLRRAAQ